MKTAMQQLKNDILIELKLGHISEHCASRILNYINTLYLEKEKKQIKDAYETVWNWNFDGEKYYNKTYNNENTNSDIRL